MQSATPRRRLLAARLRQRSASDGAELRRRADDRGRVRRPGEVHARGAQQQDNGLRSAQARVWAARDSCCTPHPAITAALSSGESFGGTICAFSRAAAKVVPAGWRLAPEP